MFSNKKLIFNNYQAEELGFIVVEGAPEILAQESYELIPVEGINGSLIINKGSYPDIEKTFTITAVDYMDDDDIEGMINSIKQWFFNITDNRLFYAFENKYNIVKKVIFTEDIRTSFEQFGDFQVTFLCEPFYYIEEEDIVIERTDEPVVTHIFTNNGDFESFPFIRVYGAGDVKFELNGVEISIENVSEFVDIDSKLLLCLDSQGRNKITEFVSDFPTLKMGDNEITIREDKGVSRIEIKPRTIYR